MSAQAKRLSDLTVDAEALADTLRARMHAQLEADDLTLFERLYRLHRRAEERQERRLCAEAAYWDAVEEC